jgi:cell division protein FtsI (penicillin-binding protein 3)
MAMAYAAVANGGFLMRPYVVRRVLSPTGEVLVENQPHVVRRVISEKTSRLLASMLTEVTSEGGTGVMANIEGFDVAGKTGTAQKADLAHGGYAAKKRVGSFIGFVPAQDPRLVVLVLVDEPEVNVYGGVVAAPVFRNIARGALRQLAVAPQKTDTIPSPAGPRDAAPRRASVKTPDMPDDGTSIVPDFVGLSLREALEKARTLKMRLKMQGNGYVVKQSPAAGRRWSEDEILSLDFQG